MKILHCDGPSCQLAWHKAGGSQSLLLTALWPNARGAQLFVRNNAGGQSCGCRLCSLRVNTEGFMLGGSWLYCRAAELLNHQRMLYSSKTAWHMAR
jgi:hypothetical protein